MAGAIAGFGHQHHAIDEVTDDRERLAVGFHVAGEAVGDRVERPGR